MTHNSPPKAHNAPDYNLLEEAGASNQRPLISVVIESYNEAHGTCGSTLPRVIAALQQQTFPHHQVEIILLGSSEQVAFWQQSSEWVNFFAVKPIVLERELHYWTVKNWGAKFATGGIIALLDVDTVPHETWLSGVYANAQQGADVMVGLSLFQHQDESRSSPWLIAAAAISWAAVLGRSTHQQEFVVKSFLGHNVAFRAEILRQHPFPENLKRSFVGHLHTKSLLKSGARFSFHPDQKVFHDFTLRWWLRHRFRSGCELRLLKQIDDTYPQHPLTAKLPLLAPVLTKTRNALGDWYHWFCFSRAMQLSPAQRLALLPFVIVMSVIARFIEMLGMYASWIVPEQAKVLPKF